MIRVEGKCGISATILADSMSPEGVRLTTYEITYPRIILAEYNTHRMLARASASSRAIPFPKMVETLTGRPVRFGQANPGMQDKGEDYDAKVFLDQSYDEFGNTCSRSKAPEEAWQVAKEVAVEISKAFYEAGYHKQVYNRLTEPFQMMKTVTTATEWNNFFWLRNDGAADPTLHELARCMQEARETSTPIELYPGEWHLPYVMTQTLRGRYPNGTIYWIEDATDDRGVREISLEEALKVSAARCAAVSFRNVDYTLEKSEGVYARLVGDERKHASAFEHQATPMKDNNFWSNETKEVNHVYDPLTWEAGISHMDRSGQLWSGNLLGWVQFRKLIPGENVEG